MAGSVETWMSGWGRSLGVSFAAPIALVWSAVWAACAWIWFTADVSAVRRCGAHAGVAVARPSSVR